MRARSFVAVLVVLAFLTAGCTDQEEEGRSDSHTDSSTTLARAESATPAAGACADLEGPFAEVMLHADVPVPRCHIVSVDQRLRLENRTGQDVDVRLAGMRTTVPPGTTQTVGMRFGDYLEPGVHIVHTSLYGGGGPELWLR